MTLWPSVVSTAIATAVLVPLVRTTMLKWGVIDVPNRRSSHENPVPRGGGAACVLGVGAGAGVAELAGIAVPWPVLAAAVALAAVGLVDDRIGLAPQPRLLAQLTAGAALGGLLGGGTAAILSAAVFAVVVNVTNFMDGINGMSALTFSLWGTSVALTYYVSAPNLAVLGALTAASAIGFLPWNAPRARIFLGDVGSYFFGALAAGGIVTAVSSHVPLVFVVAPLMIYLVDVGYTLLRRISRRASITESHREHVYQQLAQAFNRDYTHLSVSALATLLAGLSVAAFLATEEPRFGAVVSAAVACLYMKLPALGRKLTIA